MANAPELHQVEPREQVGPQTGERYEYQYHQAAAEALALLDDTQIVCVYYEWHDDYVTETAKSVAYVFHQVKTRSKAQGPWPVAEFFGLPHKRKEPARTDSAFAHLWDHTTKFGANCSRFVFVTDAGVESAFDTLLAEVKAGTALSPAAERTFKRILAQTSIAIASVDENALRAFLAKLSIQEGVGALHDLKGCRITIMNRVQEMSEVELTMPQARKIGEELVSAVRTRSHRKLDPLPNSVSELREQKGLVLDNVLKLLSLSTTGYRELKVGGQQSVLTLSRLQRFCKRRKVNATFVPDLCRYKFDWDVWMLGQKHQMDHTDYLVFREECVDLLDNHSTGKLSIKKLVQEAKNIAAKYSGKLGTAPLTGDLVMGQIVALAVEAEE